MALIERDILIDAPADVVYRISQDYAVRYDWDPFPDRIEVVSGLMEDPHPGMRVSIRSKLGMRMLVEFVQVDPPHRAAVTMVDGPALLGKFAGSWIFRALDERRTRARFRYALTVRPALLRFLVEPVAAAYFDRVVRKRLAGLKSYCERSLIPPPPPPRY